jgi:hypothetical protein
LSNVVSPEERLLQEVLERARKAEAEAVAAKAQLKTETTTSKKSLREMETALAESTKLSSKCEREYITLRDSLKGMKSAWRTDVDSLREDMRKREERWRSEAETTGKKYAKLLEECKARKSDLQSMEQLREEDARIRYEVEEELREEMRALMKERVQSSLAASAKAKQRKLSSMCPHLCLSHHAPCSLLPCVTLTVPFFYAGVYLASWLTSEDSCGLHRTNQHLKVHPHRAF